MMTEKQETIISMFFDKVSNEYACDDFVFNMRYNRQHVFFESYSWYF